MAPNQINPSHDPRQDGLLVNFWLDSDLSIKHTEFLWLSPAFINIWYDIKFFFEWRRYFLDAEHSRKMLRLPADVNPRACFL